MPPNVTVADNYLDTLFPIDLIAAYRETIPQQPVS